MGTSTLTGAEVESAMYASFSLEIRALSVMLLMVQPTNRGLKESLKYTNMPSTHAMSCAPFRLSFLSLTHWEKPWIAPVFWK